LGGESLEKNKKSARGVNLREVGKEKIRETEIV